MKKMRRKMAGIAGVITLLSLGNACARDEEDNRDRSIRFEKELDDVSLLNKWEYESITADTPEDYNGDGNKSTDILSQYPEDKKDDIIRFILDGQRYEIWEEFVKDDNFAKFLEKGTYTIEKDSKKIIMISEEGDRTVLRKVRALQDDNGHGHEFLEYRDKEDHLVVRKTVDIF